MKAGMVPPMLGEMGSRLFMPKKPRKARGTRASSQTKPAFCTKVGVPATILPRIQP
jgi:hypothetical protein